MELIPLERSGNGQQPSSIWGIIPIEMRMNMNYSSSISELLYIMRQSFGESQCESRLDSVNQVGIAPVVAVETSSVVVAVMGVGDPQAGCIRWKLRHI
jgi:hypothetical protein